MLILVTSITPCCQLDFQATVKASMSVVDVIPVQIVVAPSAPNHVAVSLPMVLWIAMGAMFVIMLVMTVAKMFRASTPKFSFVALRLQVVILMLAVVTLTDSLLVLLFTVGVTTVVCLLPLLDPIFRDPVISRPVRTVACQSQTHYSFRNAQPRFQPHNAFEGEVQCW